VLELKRFLIDRPHIIHFKQTVDVLLQGLHFEILPLIVGQNRNPILELKGVGVGCVVDQDDLGGFPVDDAEIFDV
jgi:hypothetical protein